MAVTGTSERGRRVYGTPSGSSGDAASADRENGVEEEVTSLKSAEATAAAAAAAEADTSLDLDELVNDDADIAFEQELRRDPYQVKVWLAYLKSRTKAKPAIRYVYGVCTP
ncbi:hypothetical protein EMWEY_00053320 [Eimeria maxima]|uniref:Uncharacterized protein n=1 Tax=Eimeria maxima TaxID=5804 RepID=U6M3W7_EIMMA|nr:hypothetical protein EMWEY_00053320 [Eimeria maxima]CDJ56390.1 hypothetical protein EMWEY_00053320 [Eimeria maxima]